MKKIKNILILAGGDSTRFWPLLEKSLFTFLGKPIFFYHIEKLINYSNNIVIIINKDYRERVVQLINQLNYRDRVKIIIQEDNLNGQAGAILSAKDKIDGEALVLNAEDIFKDNLIFQCINRLKQNQSDYFFVAQKVEKYFPGGYIKFDNKKIKEIVEKPGIGHEPSDIVKLVIDYFKNFCQLINALEKVDKHNDDQYERAINILLKQNINTDFILYHDFWYSLKYPWHVLSMMKYFLSTISQQKIGKNVIISKTAIINGITVLGDNVKIGDYVKISGPCYIGKDTVIADYAMVRESHIGDNCLVGGYSEVARSYLSNKVMLHRNYVGDSVLGEGVLMGSGAVTANFRFDEKNVYSIVGERKIDTNLNKCGTVIGSNSKIGVNTTIFPGVKIGRNTFVSPSEIVDKDIEDNIFYKKGKISKNNFI